MRHKRKTVKLGRTAEHRKALLANQVVSLIEHERIKTTVAKAKAVQPLAEKMVTLAKRGDLHAFRLAIAYLKQKTAVHKLFKTIALRSQDRQGGYTRIIKLGPRQSDSAPMAYIEWTDRNVEISDSETSVDKADETSSAPASGVASPVETTSSQEDIQSMPTDSLGSEVESSLLDSAEAISSGEIQNTDKASSSESRVS